MKIEIKYGGGILNLPASVAEHARSADENQLKVLLSIFNYLGFLSNFDACLEKIAGDLELDIREINSALAFWAEKGVLSVEGLDAGAVIASQIDTCEKNAMPTYTGKQIASFIEENKEIETLFNSCQAVLDKSFNTPDYNNVIYLKSFYSFSDEYILMLLEHCKECDKASWAYIRKTAKNLYDEGIDTYDKLESHFAARRNKRSLEYKIRRLFGIGEREFIKREREIFEGWINAKISFELIEKAYEVTVANTSKASPSYTAKVIENWLSSGIKTAEDAEKAMQAYKDKNSVSGPSADDLFEAAILRSQEEFKKGNKK
ncbi:MAG: DnaD domain protein [Clostridia bacterium]|nr:DnaD domain protein [Clostridia bacterium]